MTEHPEAGPADVLRIILWGVLYLYALAGLAALRAMVAALW